MKNDQIFEEIFVPELHQKFLNETQIGPKFEAFMAKESAQIQLDHGATRTVDPEIHALIVRIAKSFGLQENRTYQFPKQHLSVTDLQHNDRYGFKWFSALIHTDSFSKSCQAAIQEDLASTHHHLKPEAYHLLEKLERDTQLEKGEAESFVHEILYHFLTRQGPLLKESLIEKIQAESEETINALVIGPEFNHLGYLLNGVNLPGYYGIEIIDVFNQKLKAEGFAIMPHTLGDPGEIVRQNATAPDVIPFKIEAKNGEVIEQFYPAKFVEIVQRGIEKSEDGAFLFDEKGHPKLYQSLLVPNIKSIYQATN